MSADRCPATIVAASDPAADPAYGAIVPPLWLSDSYAWPTPDDKPPFDYARTVNPNRNLLIDRLAALEGAAGGVVTNSGQSAALLVLLSLPGGARVVAPHDGYGGTWRLLDGMARQGRIALCFVDQNDPAAMAEALAPGADLLWIETPSNPLLRLVDVRRVAAAGRAAGARVVADNTLLSPCRQRPLDLGCDMVIHSTTKILNGHADVIGGAVLARDPADVEELAWWSNAAGLNGSAFDAAQTLRGLRTLPLRIDRQERSAQAIAGWLEQQQAVAAVHYPRLDEEWARAQQSGGGYVLSFALQGGKAATDRFVAALRLIRLAPSLGGFATLICTPASMTHRGMSAAAQQAAGIDPGLLRLAVGLEEADDLIADLARGLAALA